MSNTLGKFVYLNCIFFISLDVFYVDIILLFDLCMNKQKLKKTLKKNRNFLYQSLPET